MAKGKKPLVVVTRKLPDTVETRMRELFDTRLNLDNKPMGQAELAEAIKVADVLVPTVTDRDQHIGDLDGLGEFRLAIKVADVLVPTVTDRIDSALLSQSGEKL